MSSRLLCLLAVAATLGSAAAAPPDPADPRATTPAPIVKPPAPSAGTVAAAPGAAAWRQATRRVHEAGGWRALLRESQAANAPARAASAPASAASAPAGGHHHH